MHQQTKVSLILVAVASLFAAVLAHGAGDALITQAEKLLRAGRTDDARVKITAYINEHNDVKGYIQIGNLYARLKRWGDSVHYIQIATNRNPRDAFAWYELGLALHQNKQVDEAVKSLRESISISSTTPKSIFALGEILELAHDRIDARNLYQSALKKIGPRADLYSKLCWLNFQDSFFRETVKICSKAFEMEPHDYISQTLLGKVLYESGKHEEGIKTLGEVIQKFPKLSLPYRARGLIYYQEKTYEQAISDLGKAFGLDRLDDEAGIHLARALFEQKQYELALPIYAETCRLNREYRFEMLSKQRELLRLNKDELASEYEKALDKI